MTACSFLLTSYVVAVLLGRIVAVMGRANPRTTRSLPQKADRVDVRMSLQHTLHYALTASESKFPRIWSCGSRPVAIDNKKHICTGKCCQNFPVFYSPKIGHVYLNTMGNSCTGIQLHINTVIFFQPLVSPNRLWGTPKSPLEQVTYIPFVTLTPVLRVLRNRCASVPPHHTLTRFEGSVLNYRNILYNVRRANREKRSYCNFVVAQYHAERSPVRPRLRSKNIVKVFVQ